jgi:hypothetical protein
MQGDLPTEALFKQRAGGGPLDPEAAGLAADIKAMIADGELDGWNTDAAIGKPRPPVDLSPSKFYGTKASKAKLRTELERHFGGTPRAPLAVTGAISSSDRLIKDTALLARWQESARQVIAVEMESAGVYKATHGRAPFLAIRGVSDVVGHERHPTGPRTRVRPRPRSRAASCSPARPGRSQPDSYCRATDPSGSGAATRPPLHMPLISASVLAEQHQF